MMNMSSSSSLPQPNSNATLLNVEASNGLFEPAAGLSNVFGPKGLFPFTDVFKCADALTCGVSAGEAAKFTGTFEQGNKQKMTGYEAYLYIAGNIRASSNQRTHIQDNTD